MTPNLIQNAWQKLFTPPEISRGENIHELMAHELRAPDARVEIDAGLIGLAFSGGGIRSATYCLGLLQALARRRLLGSFDYVSTVSGGGYLGSFWSALRTRDPNPEATLSDARSAPVRHLREFSNYLSPRRGIFTLDTGRLITAPIAATLPALAIALSLILLALQLWSVLLWLTFPLPASAAWARFLPIATVTLLTLITLTAFELAWRRRETEVARLSGRFYALLSAISIVLVALFWTRYAPTNPAVFSRAGLPLYRATGFQYLPQLLAPVAAWATVLIGLVGVRALTARFINSAPRVQARAALDRVLARLLFLIAFWAVPGLIWFTTVRYSVRDFSADATMLGALLTGLTGLFVAARKVLGREPAQLLKNTVWSRLKPRLPQLLAATIIVLLVIAVGMAMVYSQDRAQLRSANAIAFLVVASALAWFHPNRIGLHSFYRSRLARAYAGASNPNPALHHVAEEAQGDDIPINEVTTERPIHLVCCAANDLTPAEPLGTLDRGATSAVLSPVGFSVDRRWKLWRTGEATPTLGSAMTASGAAFNSLMGSFSKQFGLPVVFLMAALNLRLGLWLHHPHAPARRSKEWSFPGKLFIKELFGISSASNPKGDVHLSDGGHFDNTGIYELLRRRCTYIMAADCGADPNFEFNDLANLMRRARHDFGADIRIDVAPLKPSFNGERRHAVLGEITYDDGRRGYLLLFKPTLTGDEPLDIEQYKTRNPSFPAETTGDQFYDEAQWESYRRLGEFAAESMLQQRPQQLATPVERRNALRGEFVPLPRR